VDIIPAHRTPYNIQRHGPSKAHSMHMQPTAQNRQEISRPRKANCRPYNHLPRSSNKSRQSPARPNPARNLQITTKSKKTRKKTAAPLRNGPPKLPKNSSITGGTSTIRCPTQLDKKANSRNQFLSPRMSSQTLGKHWKSNKKCDYPL